MKATFFSLIVLAWLCAPQSLHAGGVYVSVGWPAGGVVVRAPHTYVAVPAVQVLPVQPITVIQNRRLPIFQNLFGPRVWTYYVPQSAGAATPQGNVGAAPPMQGAATVPSQ